MMSTTPQTEAAAGRSQSAATRSPFPSRLVPLGPCRATLETAEETRVRPGRPTSERALEAVGRRSLSTPACSPFPSHRPLRALHRATRSPSPLRHLLAPRGRRSVSSNTAVIYVAKAVSWKPTSQARHGRKARTRLLSTPKSSPSQGSPSLYPWLQRHAPALD